MKSTRQLRILGVMFVTLAVGLGARAASVDAANDRSGAKPAGPRRARRVRLPKAERIPAAWLARWWKWNDPLLPGETRAVRHHKYAMAVKTGVMKQRWFEDDRGLDVYQKYLGPHFTAALQRADLRWADLGSGPMAVAMRQYARGNRSGARRGRDLLAIDITGGTRHGGQVRFHRGYLQSLSRRERRRLGQRHLTTCFFGPTSYGFDLTATLQASVDLLAVGGRSIIVTLGSQEDELPLIGVRGRSGEHMSLGRWLATVPGLTVVEDVEFYPDGEYSETITRLVIEKQRERVVIPELRMIEVDDVSRRPPPSRLYAQPARGAHPERAVRRARRGSFYREVLTPDGGGRPIP